MLVFAMSMRRGLAALGLLTIIGFLAGDARAAALEEFFGTYVGHAYVEDLASGTTSSRDMDIVIEPFADDGFRIYWITVVKVDDRRDLPGVRRMVQSAAFEPNDDGSFFVEVAEANPFREREEMEPMRGHAVRWANIDDQTLHVYSFVVLEDGRYELQVYDRILTDIGLDIVFRRFDDGELVRQIDGRTVRAEP